MDHENLSPDGPEYPGKARRGAGTRCWALLLAGLWLLFLAGCSSQPPPAKTELQGSLKVSGAWALYPMVVKWTEEFTRLHPDVRIDVSAGGAGKGIADTLAGMVDLGMVSREIRPEEVARGAWYVPVVKDAVVATVSADNPVLEQLRQTGFSREKLALLWIEGKPLTWGFLAGNKEKKQVQVYTRSDSCGAAETWAKYLGGEQEDLKGVSVYGDPGLAQAVRSDPLGLGFNNLNFAFDATTDRPVEGLAVVPLDADGNGQADPAERLDTKAKAIEAIAAGVYPSPPARDLYLVARGGVTGLAREFVRWALTDGLQYVEGTGYIRLSESQIRQALRQVDAR